jgi:hypothetical protein
MVGFPTEFFTGTFSMLKIKGAADPINPTDP